MHFTHSSEREALIIMMNTSSIVDATTNTNSISCLEAEGLPCYGNIWLYDEKILNLQSIYIFITFYNFVQNNLFMITVSYATN